MNSFSSKIFIDGGDPEETAKAVKSLGFLNGQTTNPTLIARNLAGRLNGQKISQSEALEEYKKIVQEMSNIIPDGSISIQVFANQETKAQEMITQARQRHSWIPNSSIKLPCIKEGLKAAEVVCQEMPINITLVFSQSQAAAVYEATKKAKYPVFISPFVGRLDDRGENGMQIVENIIKMYMEGDHHVEVLTASVRNIDHLLYALQLKSDIITIPFKVFSQWAEMKFEQPDSDYEYPHEDFMEIPYRENIVLGKPWQEYDIYHELTDKGVAAFWHDWMGLF